MVSAAPRDSASVHVPARLARGAWGLILMMIVLGLPLLSFGQSVQIRPVETGDGGRILEVEILWKQDIAAAIDSVREGRWAIRALGGEESVSHVVELQSLAQPTLDLLDTEYAAAELEGGLAEQVPSVWQQRSWATLSAPGLSRKRAVSSLDVQLVRFDGEERRLLRLKRLRLRVRESQPPGVPAPRRSQLRLGERAESVLASGTIVKFPVSEEGVYRIGRTALAQLLDQAGVEVDEVDPRTLQIFGNGGRMLPALNSAPRPDGLVENPILVEGGEDGSFDAGDQILFYASGLTNWSYDEGEEEWRADVHQFATTNYYFLKVGGEQGERISRLSYPDLAGTQRVSSVTGRLHLPFDEYNWSPEQHGSGRTWVSRLLLSGQARTLLDGVRPPGLTSGSVEYEARVAVQAYPSAPVLFLANGAELADVRLARLAAQSPYLSARDRTVEFMQEGRGDAPLRLTMELEDNGGNARAAIDYLTARYPKALVAEEGWLRFGLPPTDADLTLELGGFGAAPRVWTVSDPGQVEELAVREESGRYLVQLPAGGAAREVVAFSSDAVESLPEGAAEPVANQNLRGTTSIPELIVVTPEVLRPAAERFADYRRTQGLAVQVASIEEIYNEFSGGVPDMRAVRDYFRFVYETDEAATPRFRYALLFGDGHFNFRELGGEPPENENHIFPYETEESFHADQSYTSDDYFGLLDPNEGRWPWGGRESAAPSGEPVELVDIGIGRFTVQTLEEGHAVVDKVMRYEAPETFGQWRSRYVFAADDGFQRSETNDDYDLHVLNAEVAANVVEDVAPAMHLNKIYGPSYDRVFQTEWRLPGARQEILESISEGTLVFNYSGHGGPAGLADEDLLTREDAREMQNADRLPVFVTATCSFGRWDMADEQSGAEVLLHNPEGGAAAMLTTVRLVYTSPDSTSLNPGLNRAVNRALFRREGGLPVRLGDAMVETKATTVGRSGNSRKFNLLGDPTMRLGVPVLDAAVTQLDDQALADSLVPLSALGRMSLEGEVRQDGRITGSFDGVAEIIIYDAAREVRLPYSNAGSPTYTVREDRIWRGRVPVEGGRFQGEFVVPKDISYSGERGRIDVYAWSDRQDAHGSSERVVVEGTADDPVEDSEGPELRLFLNDTTFVSGGYTPPDGTLIVQLEDESGINAVGTGVGHDLLLTIDGEEGDAVSLTEYFESDLGSYRSGEIRYDLGNYVRTLEPGPHQLRVKAWDVVNNAREATLDFVVSSAQDLALRRIYPYPNPSTGPTRFVFEHNRAGELASVRIRIYTVSGRPVRTITTEEALPAGLLPAGPVQVHWDGRDADGDLLSPGVYLYHLRVEAGNGERRATAEHVDKIALIR